MSHAADRNLLFGMLALQNNFISREQLLAAFNTWVLDKGKALGTILHDQGALVAERRQLLDALVGEHLRQHDGDPQQSLAAVPVSSRLKEQIKSLCHPDLEASLAHLASDSESDPEATRSQSIGESSSAGSRFRILRPHAEGGLGKVSVALDGELNREVALKEIKERLADDPSSRGRFVLEAEITGGLEHPGIVPVYGLGAYADGRPFYAMRFIRGDSLKDAIGRFHRKDEGGRMKDEREVGRDSVSSFRLHPSSFASLEFRQLLGRFVDVCNAIAYAHSRGVLHRDLKPGNIMLGKYGETLVVDWGLAKAVGQSSPAGNASDGTKEATLRPHSGSGVAETAAGAAVGTPAYMSPEQAEGKTEQLGPATDVYSLGGTLFCLLTNRPPVKGSDVGEVLGKVRRGDIPSAGEVHPAVPRPLAAICRKAMARRPADRYPSALALAQDLERWLADEPVSCFPEPVLARVGRFARKHRTLVTAAAAVLLATSAGLGIGLAAVEYERRQTAQERDKKIVALDKLSEEQKRTQQALATETQARSLAMKALRTLTDNVVGEQGLQQRPHLTEADRNLLSIVHGLYDELAAFPGNDPEQRAIRADGYFFVAYLRGRQGELQATEEAYREALKLYRQLAAEFPSRADYRQNVGQTLNNLGIQLYNSGRAKEAEKMYADALALQKSLVAEFPEADDYREDLIRSYLNLGNVLRKLGRPKEAEPAYAGALKLSSEDLAFLKAKFGAGHHYTFETMGSLARLYQAAGRPSDALKLFEETLPFQKAKLGADHADTLKSMAGLANSYHAVGRHEDALKLRVETLQLRKAKLGADHIDTLRTMAALAQSYQAVGRTQESLKLRDETLRLQKATLGANHPDTLMATNSLAWQLATAADVKHRDPLRAVELAAKAVEMAPTVPSYRGTLGTARYRAGQWKEAISDLEKAIGLHNPGEKGIAYDGFFIAMAHWRLGDKEKAREWFAKSVEWMNTNKTDDEELNRFHAEASALLHDSP